MRRWLRLLARALNASETGYQLGLIGFVSLSNSLRMVPYLLRIHPQYIPRILFVVATSLTAPLRAWEILRHGRRIGGIRISPPPIFVIGHWRSGTTHLHNLHSAVDDAAGDPTRAISRNHPADLRRHGSGSCRTARWSRPAIWCSQIRGTGARSDRQLRPIYTTLGLPGYGEAETAFRAYVASQKTYQKNRLTLPVEDERAATERRAFAFEAFDYPRRSSVPPHPPSGYSDTVTMPVAK